MRITHFTKIAIASTLFAVTTAGCVVPPPNKGEASVASRPSITAEQTASIYSYGDHEKQTVNVWTPSTANGKAVIYVHGGAWTHGTPTSDTPDFVYDLFADGYTIFSIGYRLASDAPWPAQIQDVKLATRWIDDNGDSFGINPQKKAIAGFSAGGHLATMAALTPGRWEPDAKKSTYDMAINYAGITNVESYWNTNSYGSRESIKQVVGHTPTTSEMKSMSPITYLDATDPLVFSIHGSADGLVRSDQSVEFTLAQYAIHGFDAADSIIQIVEGGRHVRDMSVNMRALTHAMADRIK